MVSIQLRSCLRPAFAQVRRTNRGFATVQSGPLSIEPISGSIGAEVQGLNIANLDNSTASQVREAWLKHKVLFFRDQSLTLDQFRSFSALFGEPIRYPFVQGLEDYPEIIQVLKKEDEKNNFGGIWHSDTIYLERPPMATMLHAQELPPYGGDTLFANQVAAYEALSVGLKEVLSKLTCVNTSAKADVSKTREDRVKGSSQKQEDLVSYHPAVRYVAPTGTTFTSIF